MKNQELNENSQAYYAWPGRNSLSAPSFAYGNLFGSKAKCHFICTLIIEFEVLLTFLSWQRNRICLYQCWVLIISSCGFRSLLYVLGPVRNSWSTACPYAESIPYGIQFLEKKHEIFASLRIKIPHAAVSRIFRSKRFSFIPKHKVRLFPTGRTAI